MGSEMCIRDSRAAEAMKGYLAQKKKLDGVMERLEQLREAYGRGDRSQAGLILELEGQLDKARAELRTLRDNVIKLEQN